MLNRRLKIVCTLVGSFSGHCETHRVVLEGVGNVSRHPGGVVSGRGVGEARGAAGRGAAHGARPQHGQLSALHAQLLNVALITYIQKFITYNNGDLQWRFYPAPECVLPRFPAHRRQSLGRCRPPPAPPPRPPRPG